MTEPTGEAKRHLNTAENNNRNRIGSWADEPCFYVTIVDGPKFALLLGPFRTESACREYAYIEESDGGNHAKHLAMIRKAGELDAKSAFYGFGMSKIQDGYRTGILNKHLDVPVSDYFGRVDRNPDNHGQAGEIVAVCNQKNV